MHVIIHLLTARLPQIKEANYGYNTLDFLNNHTIKRIPVF